MSDIVEQSLREFFKKKMFKPGDPLPKERDLAAALGVSRNAVREGLGRLKILGMVETRKRRGMLFARPDVLSTIERLLDPDILDKESLHDLFEIRLMLEMGLADLLFIRKSAKSIELLEAIVKLERKENNKTTNIADEIIFHSKLFELSGNHTLKRLQEMLLPIFNYVVMQEPKGHANHSRVSHRDLVNILKTGKKEDFQIGMFEHLQPHFEVLKKR